MSCVARKLLRRWIWVGAHAMERQRLHCLREGGIRIGVLSPAIHQKQKIAFPSWPNCSHSLRGERQSECIARTHDDHLVLDTGPQSVPSAIATLISGGP